MRNFSYTTYSRILPVQVLVYYAIKIDFLFKFWSSKELKQLLGEDFTLRRLSDVCWLLNHFVIEVKLFLAQIFSLFPVAFHFRNPSSKPFQA